MSIVSCLFCLLVSSSQCHKIRVKISDEICIQREAASAMLGLELCTATMVAASTNKAFKQQKIALSNFCGLERPAILKSSTSLNVKICHGKCLCACAQHHATTCLTSCMYHGHILGTALPEANAGNFSILPRSACGSAAGCEVLQDGFNYGDLPPSI